MNEGRLKKLDDLNTLSAAATQTPWVADMSSSPPQIARRTIPQVSIGIIPSENDLRFIASMRNVFDDLLHIAEASKALRDEIKKSNGGGIDPDSDQVMLAIDTLDTLFEKIK